jgi:hypothetical protein
MSNYDKSIFYKIFKVKQKDKLWEMAGNFSKKASHGLSGCVSLIFLSFEEPKQKASTSNNVEQDHPQTIASFSFYKQINNVPINIKNLSSIKTLVFYCRCCCTESSLGCY